MIHGQIGCIFMPCDGVCGTCHTIYYSRAAWCATAAAASLAICTVHLVQRKCIYIRIYISYYYYRSSLMFLF